MMLQALHDDKQGIDFIWPVMSPILGVVVVGYLALHVFPDLIEYDNSPLHLIDLTDVFPDLIEYVLHVLEHSSLSLN